MDLDLGALGKQRLAEAEAHLPAGEHVVDPGKDALVLVLEERDQLLDDGQRVISLGAILDLVKLVEQGVDRDHRHIIVDVLEADVVSQEAAQLVGVEFAEAFLVALGVNGGLEAERLEFHALGLALFISGHGYL